MKQTGRVLVIDDGPGGRERMAVCLSGQGYDLAFANSSLEVISRSIETVPDVIVLNVSMPGAIQVCRTVRAHPLLATTPLILVTRADDHDARLLGIEAGADDLLSMPLDAIELRTRVRTMVRLNRYQRQILEAQSSGKNLGLERAFDAALESWGRALELRDVEPEGHTRRVTDMALHLGRAMGMSDAELVHVRRGALLHDVGKMGIPDRIMFKLAPLDEEEWEIMRQHPVYAYELLSPIANLELALDIPYCHHEKWDGTGYPRGLVGGQIPLAARVFAVVDVWDALHADRSYRRAWSATQVDDYIHEQTGTHFDPEVVQVFFKLLVSVKD